LANSKLPFFNKFSLVKNKPVLTNNVLSSFMSTKKTTTKKAIAKTATKKPALKKVAKKTVTKKFATKKPEKGKKLVAATGANCFWVHNGPILKDLLELEKALNEMSDKVFTHHVFGKRNDFADWVETVLKDSETATAFRKAKKPKTARTVVVRQLKLYKLPNTK